MVEVARRLKPDIAVISIAEDEVDAMVAAAELCEEVPDTGVVAVSRRVCDVDLRRALDAGIPGLVHQAGGFEQIRDALRIVRGGGHFYSAEFMARIDPTVTDFKPGKSVKTRSDLLSDRENQLLRVLAIGRSLKTACEELGITYKTADKQKVSLMKKLDIHDRVSLARFAIREGIVEA
ncbi:MAG: DNA-binding response regulator [Phycisphaerae bacterium]|nr:MAG: DNA-binding response regulator [Phycisphaerae bacterium]